MWGLAPNCVTEPKCTESGLKKSQICPIWGQSDQFVANPDIPQSSVSRVYLTHSLVKTERSNLHIHELSSPCHSYLWPQLEWIINRWPTGSRLSGETPVYEWVYWFWREKDANVSQTANSWQSGTDLLCGAGMSGFRFVHKVGQIGPNGTNTKLFEIKFQYILAWIGSNGTN